MPRALFEVGVAASDSFIFLSGGTSGTVSSSNVYSAALPAPPGTPVATGLITNGGYQFTVSTAPNTGFGIQASTSLLSWTNIGWGFTDTNGLLSFRDTNAANFPNRFYRAYWPLP